MIREGPLVDCSVVAQFCNSKIGFEHIFIAFFGSSIFPTISISKTYIQLCFFHKSIPFSLQKVSSIFGKHHVCHRKVPCVGWSAPTMVIKKVDCCRGVAEVTFSS